MQKVEQCRSNCRAQLNNEIFALLPTRFYCLKIDHLIKRIGINLPFHTDKTLRHNLLHLFVLTHHFCGEW
ncbi:hypothetical protein EXT43_18850 [Pseudoalteromonas sp. CO109Y]|nr:hypothetical protein EXT43_18850 [Pseudoalteromonas sp. CO109Y]TMO39224.1 hypothetical protein CWC27_01895 [Pseudoalteromonas sp. S4491]